MSRGRPGTGRSDEPQALGAVLDALGGERRLAAGLLLGSLGKRWDAVVGERLAEESTPAALEGGVLLVKASSAAWAAQIKFLARDIRDAANRLVEGVTGPTAGAGGAARNVDDPPIREVRVTLGGGPPTG